MTPLERAAKAAYEEWRNTHPGAVRSWDQLVDMYEAGPAISCVVDDYRRSMRAALETLLEPTDSMLDAGVAAKMTLYAEMEARGESTGSMLVAKHPAGTIWQAMLRRLLDE